jgi:endoglucanase
VNTSTASYVRDGSSANTNFGQATSLEVKKSTTGFNRETYIKFDLTSLTTISNATLRLFGHNQDTTSPSVNIGVFATSLADSKLWTENGITFTNKPPAPTSVTNFNVNGTTNTTYNINVTTFLQQRKAAGDTQVTFVLRSNTSTSTLTSFNSDEAASNKPVLIVTP